jgi:hypothetical protein
MHKLYLLRFFDTEENSKVNCFFKINWDLSDREKELDCTVILDKELKKLQVKPK